MNRQKSKWSRTVVLVGQSYMLFWYDYLLSWYSKMGKRGTSTYTLNITVPIVFRMCCFHFCESIYQGHGAVLSRYCSKKGILAT